MEDPKDFLETVRIIDQGIYNAFQPFFQVLYPAASALLAPLYSSSDTTLQFLDSDDPKASILASFEDVLNSLVNFSQVVGDDLPRAMHKSSHKNQNVEIKNTLSAFEDDSDMMLTVDDIRNPAESISSSLSHDFVSIMTQFSTQSPTELSIWNPPVSTNNNFIPLITKEQLTQAYDDLSHIDELPSMNRFNESWNNNDYNLSYNLDPKYLSNAYQQSSLPQESGDVWTTSLTIPSFDQQQHMSSNNNNTSISIDDDDEDQYPFFESIPYDDDLITSVGSSSLSHQLRTFGTIDNHLTTPLSLSQRQRLEQYLN